MIHLVEGEMHPESFTSEIFACDGRWQTSGAGHSDQAGTFTIQDDVVCVTGAGDFALCRRVEMISGDSLRLHPIAPQEGASSLYRIDPQSLELCD